jgi:hypothetical protein
MGYVGKVALAAHGIALLWLSVALMIPDRHFASGHGARRNTIGATPP